MTTTSSTVREIEIRTADGILLRGRWWRRQAPRAAMILAHGFSEHGGTHRHVAETLSRRLDIDVIVADFRGHGTSPGRRGVVGRYEELTDDLTSVVEWMARQRPDLPRLLLGHSNGGQVALRFVMENRIPVEAMILSNPALRVALPIPPHKLWVGKLLRKYAPWVTLSGRLRTELLTRDPEFQRAHRNDTLRHNRMSAPLFFGMLEGGEMLMACAGKIHTPTLMIVGGQDPIVDPSAARELFDRLGTEDKMLLFYPKMLHEPFNEVGREQVFDDVVHWLEPRLPHA